MYILSINTDAPHLIDESQIDSINNGTIEMHFLTEKNAKSFGELYKKVLKDTDSEIWHFWRDEEEEESIENTYTENGVKQSYFY